MRLEDFDYELPREAIAREPPARRGDSRLMVVDRRLGGFFHTSFARLSDWLRSGDVLVRNDTRVIPARLRGVREGGGAVEVLLIRKQVDRTDGEVWSCLARPGRRLRIGRRVTLAGGLEGRWIDAPGHDGSRRIVLRGDRPVEEVLERAGEVPLPPYLDRPADERDRAAYQTVYARRPGAVAAPTAGLHFTADHFEALRAAGIEVCDLTLHVGPGTFLPVRAPDIENHRLAAEEVHVPVETASAVRRAREEGRRVIAVGTTSVRALEGLVEEGSAVGRSGFVSLFVRPGYRFRVVDALVTNFHLPRSTLLMLVAAFAGRELVLAAYREAVARGYRFYSYGDAMLVV